MSRLRTRLAATAVACATAVSMGVAPVQAAESSNDSSSDTSNSSISPVGGVGLAVLGGVFLLVFAEGIVSMLNAPYCGANPDKCPNSLAASLSSTASSNIDNLRHAIPRVPIR